MGYFSYRVFKGVPVLQLREQVEANLRLFREGSVGSGIRLQLIEGNGCAALLLENGRHVDQLLWPVGPQLCVVWMDVQYQDGDSWQVSLYDQDEQRCVHNLNPWAWDEHVNYDEKAIEFRIRRICEAWPEQADRIRPYLLLWFKPVGRLGQQRLTARAGKAHPDDRCGYGSADQIFDFLRCFGVGKESTTIWVGRGD